MKKKIVFSFILGILISSVAYAAVSLSSDKVGYNDTTVKDSLDTLFDELASGKNNIITALSNKGFNVQDGSTYTDIVNSINELPVTIGKDSDGNYGYYNDDGSFNNFKSEKTAYFVKFTSSDASPAGYWYSSLEDGGHSFNYPFSEIELCDGFVSVVYSGYWLSMKVKKPCYVNGVARSTGDVVINNIHYQELSKYAQFIVAIE